MNKYSVNREIKSLIKNCINSDTGEIINSELIKELNMPNREKAENLGHAFFILSDEIDSLDKELSKLTFTKNKKKIKLEGIKNCMDAVLEGEKFEGNKVAVSYKKSDVLVCDEAVVPQKFFNKSFSMKLDKNLIKQQLKAGKKVEGCFIESRNNIIIKEV